MAVTENHLVTQELPRVGPSEIGSRSVRYRLIKFILDVCVASVMLVLSVPIIALCALAVRLNSSGSQL
jgi:lipopolysaccharide/colanic/teichoic acid biosynthesis glycosyltransferase